MSHVGFKLELMDYEDDDEDWDRDDLLAEAGRGVRSLCRTLYDAVDETNTFVVDEDLPDLRPAVTKWLATLSELLPDAHGGATERSEAAHALPDAAASIDISRFFPAPDEIDEPDEDLRWELIEDERRCVATHRVSLAKGELFGAFRTLEGLSFDTPTDSSPISGLAVQAERLVRLIEQWHEVWMMCLHGYYGVHGRYPGVAGDAVEAFEDWLGQMRFDTELRRLLEERDV